MPFTQREVYTQSREVYMSRQDHRNYDDALERLRREAQEIAVPQRMRRKKRDRAVTFILGLAGIGLTFVGILWAALCWFICLLFLADWIGNSERVAGWPNRKIRFTQVAAILIGTLVGIGPTYHQWRVEQAAKLEGWLVPRDVLVDAIPLLQIGAGGPIRYDNPDNSELEFFHNEGMRLEKGPHGIEFSTVVRDRQGHQVVKVEKNHWEVNPLASVDKNYTDDTLEVLDAGGHVVLQIRLLGDTAQLQGEWHNEFGRGVQAATCRAPYGLGGCIQNFNKDWVPSEELKNPIEPLFAYPSKEHWGEFVKGNPRQHPALLP